MDHLIKRMKVADCEEIRIVTRPEKEDVLDHAREHGLEVVTGKPSSVSESESLGLAGVPKDTLVLLGFPDTIWQHSCAASLVCYEIWMSHPTAPLVSSGSRNPSEAMSLRLAARAAHVGGAQTQRAPVDLDLGMRHGDVTPFST